jgi:hypothetical protein
LLLREHLSAARAALDRGDRAAALTSLNAALALDPDYLAAQAMKDQVERSPARRVAAASVPPATSQPAAGAVPDRLPTGAAAQPQPRGPLVSAEGWARFETRARTRRAERRAAAARVLIARGRFSEARGAIDEIREIDPAHPELISLSIELDAAEHMQRPSRHWGPAAAAAVVFGGLLLGARYLEVPGPAPASSTAPAIVRTAPDPAATAPQAAAAEPSPEPAPTATIGTSGMPAPEAVTTAPPDDSPALSAPEPAPAPPAPSPVASRREVPSAPPSAPAIAPLQEPAPAQEASRTVENSSIGTTATTRTVEPEPAPALLPRVAPAVTPASLPGAVAPEPAPLDAPAARALGREPAVAAARTAGAAAVAVVPDEDRVRRTLQLYQHAYESLDAQSAQAVWPRVDSIALQRAFDGLQSQRLTFDNCEVQVRGTYGSAVCHGTTRYVPKIGSRDPRVEPRTWTFALRKAGEDWQIDSARAER